MPVCLTSVMQCRVSSILEVNPKLTQNDRHSHFYAGVLHLQRQQQAAFEVEPAAL